MAKSNPRDIYEKGKRMILDVLSKGTEAKNLKNHHYGAMLIVHAVSLGRSYGGIDDSDVEQAKLLLSRSRGALKKYCKSEGCEFEVGSMFLRFQEERLETLASLG